MEKSLEQKSLKTDVKHTQKGYDRISLIIGVSLLLLCLGYQWKHSVYAEKLAIIPPQSLPNPNAYDFFRRADNGVSNRKLIESLSSATLLRKPKAPSLSLEKLSQLAEENRQTLNTIREATKYPFVEPNPARYFHTKPINPHFEILSRLFVLSAMSKEKKGDFAGAIGDEIDGLEASDCISRGEVSSRFSSVYIPLGSYYPNSSQLILKLNAKQCRSAIARLEKTLSNEIPVAKVLTDQKWRNLTRMEQFYKELKDLKPDTNADNGVVTSVFGDLHEIQMRSLYDQGEREAMKMYMDGMDIEIKNAGALTNARFNPGNIFGARGSGYFATDVNTWKSISNQNRSESLFLLYRLATHSYVLEHGKLPTSIEALAPAYLSNIYPDPQFFGKKFTIKPNGTGYTILNGGGLNSPSY